MAPAIKNDWFTQVLTDHNTVLAMLSSSQYNHRALQMPYQLTLNTYTRHITSINARPPHTAHPASTVTFSAHLSGWRCAASRGEHGRSRRGSDTSRPCRSRPRRGRTCRSAGTPALPPGSSGNTCHRPAEPEDDSRGCQHDPTLRRFTEWTTLQLCKHGRT